jgi:hypothetical protein
MSQALVLASTATVLEGASADPACHCLWMLLRFLLFHILLKFNNGLSSLIEYLINVIQIASSFYSKNFEL